MMHYEVGTWGVTYLFTIQGSVIPKAMAWAVPVTTLAALVRYGLGMETTRNWLPLHSVPDLPSIEVWAAYNFFIGFLLTFRAGKSYTRWWEGATLLRKARGEWCNAYSSLIAFTTSAKVDDHDGVCNFQNKLATLMSQLHCVALNNVAQMDEGFDVLNLVPMENDAIDFLAVSGDKVEVLTLWIQRLVVEGVERGLITVAAPILSRVFQELSRGVVNLNDVRKISEFLFPFPYAQLCGCMLMLHMVAVPLLTPVLVDSWFETITYCFCSVFAFQSLNYVAMEMECPFGDDENDLPLRSMQEAFNNSLMVLLESLAQKVPFTTGANDAMEPGTPKIVKDLIRSRERILIGPASDLTPRTTARQLIDKKYTSRTTEMGTVVIPRHSRGSFFRNSLQHESEAAAESSSDLGLDSGADAAESSVPLSRISVHELLLLAASLNGESPRRSCATKSSPKRGSQASQISDLDSEGGGSAALQDPPLALALAAAGERGDGGLSRMVSEGFFNNPATDSVPVAVDFSPSLSDCKKTSASSSSSHRVAAARAQQTSASSCSSHRIDEDGSGLAEKSVRMDIPCPSDGSLEEACVSMPATNATAVFLQRRPERLNIAGIGRPV